MLKEERHKIILELVNQNNFVKNIDILHHTNATIQTIIADINYLHLKKKLIKVYGGAKSLKTEFKNYESFDEEKKSKNILNKIKIAKAAANLIEDNDLIFIDTGTTTAELIPFLKDKNVQVVTNGYSNALLLLEQGIENVCLIGGTIIPTTHAIAGEAALKFLNNFHFDKAFIGMNNLNNNEFYTTNLQEALIKEKVILNSEIACILMDVSKFNSKNKIIVNVEKNIVLISDVKPSDYSKKFILAK
ncbi:DeoR/GlpR family DNA-binding transcription regulator [Spiroplasma endosymbiont of Crioceris asparagi]|uniref:DeoR/GlpR family DNA-binding transcription regulator n=1 Tax=Spiroplasma endosymbiont of Crioceris asparagi TaxID=3066286 RepID=UPI0030CACA55